ncbi:STE3-domain-containing protein [Rickenella mellea]|uniref:STE3-domain-containing protein n=1 Tax=Rickenella mellea TaxID=50990 RepID=A0A4Y7PVY4_9AGAM|nr:STE3-domain-containing protein [Rickenella mellea]
MEPTYPLYPIVSFLCFILVLAPLPTHWRLRNAGTSMYIIWTAASCLILFVNSLVWHDNAIDKAPVWCDISGRILLGNGIAIPACILCIQRRLYLITSTQVVIISQKEKRKYFIQDLFVSLGFPLLVMVLAYTVQGNRYDIYEEFGCFIPIYNVWPAYPIYYLPPLAMGLISLCYSLLTLRAFVSRRSELNEFINSGTVTFKRHVRLMCLASTDIAFTIPFCVWGLQADISTIHPYVSWEDTHFGFSIIRTYPDIIWRNNETSRILVEFCRWIVILCAVVFIAFFTFAEESRKNYGAIFCAAKKRFCPWNRKGSSTRTSDPSSVHWGNSNDFASNAGRNTVLPVFLNDNSALTLAVALGNHAELDDNYPRKGNTSAGSGSLGSSRTSVTTDCVSPLPPTLTSRPHCIP